MHMSQFCILYTSVLKSVKMFFLTPIKIFRMMSRFEILTSCIASKAKKNSCIAEERINKQIN